jgi:hypothetical protein
MSIRSVERSWGPSHEHRPPPGAHHGLGKVGAFGIVLLLLAVTPRALLLELAGLAIGVLILYVLLMRYLTREERSPT